MSTAVTDNIGASATAITITAAATLANSTIVGAQSAAVTMVDGNNNVPQAVDIEVAPALGTGTLSGDKTAYFWLAESIDGSNYSGGNPAVSGSDAGYTFANAPVGASALPTPLRFLGAITFNAQSQSLRRNFRVYGVRAKMVLVVLNYSGIAFSSFSAQYRAVQGDLR
jgi:hypothetical protein